MNKDQITFSILRCAQPEGMGYINNDIALSLMQEGLIKDVPKENWWKEGYKATPKGIHIFKEWLQELRTRHQHQWKTKADNDWCDDKRTKYAKRVDDMAFCEGYHNGFQCKKCGFKFCVHCHTELDVKPCGKQSGYSMYSDENLRPELRNHNTEEK